MLAFTNPIEISQKPRGWRAQARCNDGAATATRLFFSDDLLDIAVGQGHLREVHGVGSVPRGRARRGRALGCMGRRADLERPHRRPQTQTRPSTQTSTCRAVDRRARVRRGPHGITLARSRRFADQVDRGDAHRVAWPPYAMS